ncbi:MAG: F0F1 ATP synthase subunit B family protein [Acidobacteriota bacterium]
MNKVLVALALAAVLDLTPVLARGANEQPARETPPATAHDAQATDDHGEEAHGVWSGLLWPTVNFAVLVGGLWWFLKAPLSTYFRDRHEGIRRDLVEAAQLRAAASSQLEEIDRKLHALPAEIDALRQRGADEIVAEERRIGALAVAERERLVDQTRREMELQLRLARRELVDHAASLAVQLASDRVQQQITPTDHDRLVDRYLGQVKDHRGAAGAGKR